MSVFPMCCCWLLIVTLCICMMDSKYFSIRLLCSLHLSHFVERSKCSASLKDSAKVLEKLLAVEPSRVKLLVGRRRSIQQAEQFCCLTAAGKPQIHVTLHHHELWRPVMETDRLYMCVSAPLFRRLHSQYRQNIDTGIYCVTSSWDTTSIHWCQIFIWKHAGALNVPNMRPNSRLTALFSSDCELKRP